MSEQSRPPIPMALRSILPITLLALYLPLVVMVVGSFAPGSVGAEGANVVGQDSRWTFQWYREVFEDPVLWSALLRSVVVAFASASASTLLGLLGALALDKWEFRGKTALKAFSSLSLMLPELVLGLSLLSWFAMFGVSLSLITVVAAHVTLTLPFVILVIGARLKGLDPSLDDAARDLGAREGQILLRVTLPLLKPSLVTGFILAFLISFDDFLVTFYTNGAGGDTLPVRLYSMMKQGMSPKIQALSSIMLLISVSLIGILFQLRGLSTFSNPDE